MPDPADHRAAFDELRRVRAEAIDHARRARELSGQRRVLLQQLIDLGFSQADIGRELGVTRQAVQKMLAA